jgi:hypothetical protein
VTDTVAGAEVLARDYWISASDGRPGMAGALEHLAEAS